MSWIISATSALMLWLMGNKSIWGPRLGVFNQCLWIFYATSTKQWGLLPGVAMYTIINIRNLMKWQKKERDM